MKSKTIPKLKKREYLFLSFLAESSRNADEIRHARDFIPLLKKKLLIGVNEGILSITDAGRQALANSRKIYTDDPSGIFLAKDQSEVRRKSRERAEIFVSLYRQGLTHQKIGDLYKISRQAVYFALRKIPSFQQYHDERKQARAQRKEKREQAEAQHKLDKTRESKQKAREKSLAFQYPDRVDELWDWEKNIGLDPNQVPAGSTICKIWLKCPKDGHSWQKKPEAVVKSWKRNKTSGCPICVGRINKPKKQKTLWQVYPEIVKKYWDFDKNAAAGFDPQELTLGSNQRVWLKCPVDKHEWLAMVNLTVNQQWEHGNAGCRVCNGTVQRKDGVWRKALPFGEKFPEQVARFWNFEKNIKNRNYLNEITSGSTKKVWFKCPADNHQWQAVVSTIGESWTRGHSGCPACRGSFPESKSLSESYPRFVDQFWDFAKNQQLGWDPKNLTCGSGRKAWFKCPSDGSEWNSAINYIVRIFWEKTGKSGCPKCGKGRKAIKF